MMSQIKSKHRDSNVLFAVAGVTLASIGAVNIFTLCKEGPMTENLGVSTTQKAFAEGAVTGALSGLTIGALAFRNSEKKQKD